MNRYICTFGAGQENEGKYVLVIAANKEKAIDKMFEEYGNEWCMCYSEEQWNNTPRYIPRETLLRTIVAEEEKKISLSQIRKDFNYLNDNINNYLVNEDGLVNYVFVNMTSGTMDMKEFLLWCINDLVTHVIYDSEDEEDMEFLRTNKRALRILERYNIEIKEV